MATHSSILAWRIPWTEEPGRLQSMGLQSQTRLRQLGTRERTHCNRYAVMLTLDLADFTLRRSRFTWLLIHCLKE